MNRVAFVFLVLVACKGEPAAEEAPPARPGPAREAAAKAQGVAGRIGRMIGHGEYAAAHQFFCPELQSELAVERIEAWAKEAMPVIGKFERSHVQSVLEDWPAKGAKEILRAYVVLDGSEEGEAVTVVVAEGSNGKPCASQVELGRAD